MKTKIIFAIFLTMASLFLTVTTTQAQERTRAAIMAEAKARQENERKTAADSLERLRKTTEATLSAEQEAIVEAQRIATNKAIFESKVGLLKASVSDYNTKEGNLTREFNGVQDSILIFGNLYKDAGYSSGEYADMLGAIKAEWTKALALVVKPEPKSRPISMTEFIGSPTEDQKSQLEYWNTELSQSEAKWSFAKAKVDLARKQLNSEKGYLETEKKAKKDALSEGLQKEFVSWTEWYATIFRDMENLKKSWFAEQRLEAKPESRDRNMVKTALGEYYEIVELGTFASNADMATEVQKAAKKVMETKQRAILAGTYVMPKKK